MGSAGWTLDDLQAALRALGPRAHAWAIHVENLERRERYFLSEGAAVGLDQDRHVDARAISLKLWIPKSAGKLGEASKRLLEHRPLAAQLESVLAAARETELEAWSFPVPPASIPERPGCDPAMAEDLERELATLTDRIRAAASSAAKETGSRFHSSELFLSVHRRELRLSNGLAHRWSQSRVYVESAFSHERDGHSDEYLSTHWSVRPRELEVESLFRECAERAKQMMRPVAPETGSYAVIVDADVLSTLFAGQLQQLSGASAYQKLPFLAPGEALVPGAEGDRVTLALDPTLEFGADTVAVSDQGHLQQTLVLVEDGVVRATAMDPQYSTYLGKPATAARGNLVLSPGTRTKAEIVAETPVTLEILQFSGLFSNPHSGTFSSEIRLARLVDQRTGETKFIKGGSLSGNLRENLKNARFSKETAHRTHFESGSPVGVGYFGPAFALLSDVSVAG